MAGILKVDQLQSDSNLALSIASANVAFVDSTGLKFVGNNLSLSGNNVISSGKVVPSGMPVGSVLQVIQAVKTDTFSTSSTSFVDVTGLSVSITPTSATSKILVLMDAKLGSATNVTGYLRIVRNSTSIYIGDSDGSAQRATYGNSDDPSSQWPYQAVGNFLDSPATTSSVTYKIQILSEPVENTGTVYINRSGEGGTSASGVRTASSITVMEIAA
jgi:hypothetical protein